MGKRQVRGGMNLQLLHLEDHFTGAELHAGLPVSLIGGLTLELQFFDGIEGKDIVGVRCGDGGDVPSPDCWNPALDKLTDFVFGDAAHGRVLCDSTTVRRRVNRRVHRWSNEDAGIRQPQWIIFCGPAAARFPSHCGWQKDRNPCHSVRTPVPGQPVRPIAVTSRAGWPGT
ncbi:hypothetical protein D3C72_1899530 [compost metagenome]